MSYDIYLKDPVTKEVIEFDEPHQMKGGMFAVGGTREAWLNITYNYANYYYSATEGDDRFFGKLWYDEPKNLGHPWYLRKDRSGKYPDATGNDRTHKAYA